MSYTLAQQKHILGKMLVFVCDEVTSNSVPPVFSELQKSLEQCNDNEEIYRIANTALAMLEEDKDPNAQIWIRKLREVGFYDVIYGIPKHHPVGSMYTRLDLQKFLSLGLKAAKPASFFVAAYLVCGLAVAFLGAPYWLMAISSGLLVGASIYMAGLTYGILNGIFVVKMNFPYYLLGHFFTQPSLFWSDDKTSYAIGWGVIATAGPGGIAAFACTIAAIVLAFQTPLAMMIIPVMMLAMPIIAVSNELFVRLLHHFTTLYTTDRSDSIPNQRVKSGYWRDYGLSIPQGEILNDMCPTRVSRMSWFLTSGRNLLGYLILPTACVLSMVYLFKFSQAGLLIGSQLFPLASVIMPVVVVGIAAVFLNTCTNYVTKYFDDDDDDFLPPCATSGASSQYIKDANRCTLNLQRTFRRWDLFFESEPLTKFATKALTDFVCPDAPAPAPATTTTITTNPLILSELVDTQITNSGGRDFLDFDRPEYFKRV